MTETEKKLKRPAALKYLQDEGWEVAKTKFYDDIKKGLVSLQPDKTLRQQDLTNYARANLKRKAGAESGEAIAKDQGEKLHEEILKIRAQRENSQFDLAVKQKKFLPKADFAREMAARARVLDTYQAHYFRSNASKLIALVGGDLKKIDSFIEAIDKARKESLSRFATLDQFQVMILEGGPDDE